MLQKSNNMSPKNLPMGKKQIRAAFRAAVLSRDKYRCKICSKTGCDRQGGDGWKKYHSNPIVNLDAHHITDRTLIANQGYVPENGITVCDDCHLDVEQFHLTGTCKEGLFPKDLYQLIGSSLEKAIMASNDGSMQMENLK